MLNAVKIAACAALLLLPPALLVPSATAQTDGVDIDGALAAAREAIDAPGFSGSVVIMRNGETLMAEARGLADQTGERANTLDTRFNIASVGKFLTAIGMVRAADQAGFDNFASLRPGDILSDDADMFAERLTLGDLMSHGTDIESFFITEGAEARALEAQGNADFFDLVRLAQDGPSVAGSTGWPTIIPMRLLPERCCPG